MYGKWVITGIMVTVLSGCTAGFRPSLEDYKVQMQPGSVLHLMEIPLCNFTKNSRVAVIKKC
jgi:hypothetical protein